MKNRDSARRTKARGLLARHGYAIGGDVKEAIAAAVHRHERHDHKGKKLTKLLRRGGTAEGAEAPLRADKPRRAGGGRVKKAGTKIIIVNGQPRPLPVPVPRPVPMPVGAGARPMPAAPRPPVAAPPAGAPMPAAGPVAAARPPMAKRGGRIGTRPRLTAGAKNALGRLQKMKAYGAP
jgi:hypothetical protein